MKVGRITETGKKFVQGVQRMGEAINRAKPFIVKSSVKPPEIKPVKTLKDELIDLHKEATAELQKYFAVYEKAKGVPLKFSLKPVEAWFNELGVQTGGLQKGREYKILQLGGALPICASQESTRLPYTLNTLKSPVCLGHSQLSVSPPNLPILSGGVPTKRTSLYLLKT